MDLDRAFVYRDRASILGYPMMTTSQRAQLARLASNIRRFQNYDVADLRDLCDGADQALSDVSILALENQSLRQDLIDARADLLLARVDLPSGGLLRDSQP